MGKFSHQHGFTLIEVTLVLAISSALIVIAFAGQAALRGQAQFIDSADQIKEEILATKNESNVSQNAIGDGTDSTQQVVGKLMLFVQNATMVQIRTLKCTPNPTTDICDNTSSIGYSTETKNVEFNWGLKYSGASRLLGFFRNPNSANYEGYIVSTGVFPTAGVTTLNYFYTASTSPFDFTFVDPAARSTTIAVNPQVGTVVRSVP